MGEFTQNFAGAMQTMAKGIATGLNTAAQTNARAANKANGISAAAQNAQGQFNQGSVDIANNLATQRLMEQYQYNAGQAAMANNWNSEAWDKAAAWNEMMWQKQADFNAAEAEKNRNWQTQMANTAYQRAIADMKAAGLNPALAMGGISSNVPSGGAATVSGASMGAASANMASGGVLGADSASISNYSGQMESTAGMLGILGAVMSGLSSAAGYWKLLGDNDKNSYSFDDFVGDIFNGRIDSLKEQFNNPNTLFNRTKQNTKNYFKGFSFNKDIKKQ